MSVDLGGVSNYVGERGFGFVRGRLLGDYSEVFFHIKVIRRADQELAERIAKNEDRLFWFETEVTPKGKQVRSILLPEQVRAGAIADTSRLVVGLDAIWRDVGSQKPAWLDDVTVDLVGPLRASELSLERSRLEDEARIARELARKEMEARLAAKEEEKRRKLEAQRAQEKIEEIEFQELVVEMRGMGFANSSQVSNYIVTRNLGLKYRNISGVLQMKLQEKVWNFRGGFPPNIYARLCDELGLSNHGSRARAISFESFDSIEERTRSK
jgi:cold shock CspA family protein